MADDHPTTSSWRCKVGIHAFAKATTDDGVSYLQCSRCGKEEFPTVGLGRGVQ
jgi:hypothetical protein